MRTVTFKRVRDGVLTRMGLELDGTVQQSELDAVALYIGDRAKEAIEMYDWPEWQMLEERAYRDEYDDIDASDLVTGDIVFHDDAYWEAIVDAPATEPSESETADWAEAEGFEKYVDLDQTAQTPIGEATEAWSVNPRIDDSAVRVPYSVTERGLTFAVDAPTTVWLRYTRRPPQFSAAEWSAATAYLAGDVVYYPTAKDCYVCLVAHTNQMPSTTEDITTYWERQRLLEVISRYVEFAAFSDVLAEDGQVDKAASSLGQAAECLNEEIYKYEYKQGRQKERRFSAARA